MTYTPAGLRAAAQIREAAEALGFGEDEYALENIRTAAAELGANVNGRKPGDVVEKPAQLMDGAAFTLDQPAEVVSVWGHEDGRVLWSTGEPLMIAAPTGVGKTTVAQRLTLGRIGLAPILLGMHVRPEPEGRTLYLACDRPRQAIRSFRRMVSEDDREALEKRLMFWRGPLDFTLDQPKAGEKLLHLCDMVEATTLVVDSLKDVALDLEDGGSAGRVNAALQRVVAEEIEVIALHHQRKAQVGGNPPKTINDVYGNQQLTGGMGSVVLLWGEPGDVLVELRHLKQPAEEVGPLRISHDHHNGLPTLEEKSDLGSILKAAGPSGLSAPEAARSIHVKSSTTRNENEKARRALDKMVERGEAVHIPSTIPGEAGRYVANGGTV